MHVELYNNVTILMNSCISVQTTFCIVINEQNSIRLDRPIHMMTQFLPPLCLCGSTSPAALVVVVPGAAV